MKQSTKVLVIGLGLAGALLASHMYQITSRNHQIEGLTAQCRVQAASMLSAEKAARTSLDCDDKTKHGTPIECLYTDELVCDPSTLTKIGPRDKLMPIQQQILAAQADSQLFRGATRTALVIALLSAAPSVWYFLLRRIAELRRAFSGKSPDGW